MFHTDGSMDALTDCDLQLHSVGEDGHDPVDCKFNFTAGLQYYLRAIFLLHVSMLPQLSRKGV